MINITMKLIILAIVVLSPVSAMADWANTPAAVNSTDAGNVHYNSGGHRMARVGTSLFVLCADGSQDHIYRKVGAGSWSMISDQDAAYSSALISGPDNYIFHFFRRSADADQLGMVKFLYTDSSPPSETVIATIADMSDNGVGAYRMMDAIVDGNGYLYVAVHYGDQDHVYVLNSLDNGDTWNGPYQVSSGGTDDWCYCHLAVTTDNTLVCSYNSFTDDQTVVVATSTDYGETWTRNTVSTEFTWNPAPLTRGDAEIFLVAQSMEAAHTGLVFNYSDDLGVTWDGWSLIDETCGYGDPHAAWASNGDLYVAFRSSNGSGITEGSCGDQSKFRLARTVDDGANWTFPDDYYDGERSGTRNHIRYQTWYNYGGQLDYCWLQYLNAGVNVYTYYNYNEDVDILANSGPVTSSISTGGASSISTGGASRIDF